MQWKAGFTSFGFLAAGRKWQLWSRRPLPEERMQLVELKDGGWVYTE